MLLLLCFQLDVTVLRCRINLYHCYLCGEVYLLTIKTVYFAEFTSGKNGITVLATDNFSWTAKSRHKTGVNFLFLTGNVKYVLERNIPYNNADAGGTCQNPDQTYFWRYKPKAPFTDWSI